MPLSKDPQGMPEIKHVHALKCKLFLYCNGQIPRNRVVLNFYFILVDGGYKISFLVHFKLFFFVSWQDVCDFSLAKLEIVF